MRIATWNINSVRLRLKQVLKFIEEKNIDTLCLQETKTQDEFFPSADFLKAGMNYQYFRGEKSYNGVAILSNTKFTDMSYINYCLKSDARHISVKFKNNIQSNNHNIKYANSDKNYFNNILKIDQKAPKYNENDKEKEINYYNPSDFQKFDQLDNFSEHNNEEKIQKKISLKSNYSSKDHEEFNKIIPKRNLDQEKNNELNEKIRVIDYSKINGSEKKLKNKFGIDKIKIVYFD